jgi:hypothetical protein
MIPFTWFRRSLAKLSPFQRLVCVALLQGSTPR